jgi:cytochrome b561
MNINNRLSYSGLAKLLHWLVAILIFIALPLGVYMHDLPLSPTKLQLISYHKWLGIVILLLVVVRIIWRATHTPPPLPDGFPRWQQLASHATHHFLYLLMFAVPLSGWLMSSAKGFQTVLFGILPLPNLVNADKALGNLLGEVHEGLNVMLLLLVLLHLAAVIKHQFIDKDSILKRMLP